MNTFKPLTTEKLILRKLDTTDSNAFFKYRSLPEIYEYQNFKPINAKEADEFITYISDSPNIPNTWFQLAV